MPQGIDHIVVLHPYHTIVLVHRALNLVLYFLVAIETVDVNNAMFLCTAKGLGSFTGGQLLAHTSLEIPDIFQLTFGLTAGLALIFLIVYHTVGKRLERRHLAKKQALIERMKQEKQGKESATKDDEGEEKEKQKNEEKIERKGNDNEAMECE